MIEITFEDPTILDLQLLPIQRNHRGRGPDSVSSIVSMARQIMHDFWGGGDAER